MKKTSIKKIGLTMLVVLATGGALLAQKPIVVPAARSVVPYQATDDVAEPVTFFFNSLQFTDPCTHCIYDWHAGGYGVLGTNNCVSPGTPQYLAMPFFARFTGNATYLRAAIVTSGAPCSIYYQLGIWTDACGPNGVSAGPGTLLREHQAKAAPAICQVSSTIIAPTALVAGTKYWLVARTIEPGPQSTFGAIWYPANEAQIGFTQVTVGGWSQFSGFVLAGSVQ